LLAPESDDVTKKDKTMTLANDRSVDAMPLVIADRLRHMVASGVLGPGSRLGQNELADTFQASRVPIREALKLLTAEGFVEHDPNRGFFVARLSTEEAVQLFRLRELVEDELLMTVRWPDDKELEALSDHAEELERLLNEGKRSTWWSRHRDFHAAIFNLSPQKIMVREAMRLWSLTDRYRALLSLPRRPSAERDLVKKHDLVEALGNQSRRQLIKVRTARRRSFETLVLEVLEERGL
jgi:DNA-binding GntR family transcriptional regulator